MKQRFFALILMMLLAVCPALGETSEQSVPAVSDVGLDLLGSSVHYPQLTGLADQDLQSAVNAAIMEAGQIEARLNRMAMLISSPVKLSVSYTCTLTEDVFSCAILADGAVETNRATQIWSSVNIDLTSGEPIVLADLFTDAEAAAAFLESYLNEQVAPELSAHLASGKLTPVPETFSLSASGLTLYYPIDQFRTLSDRAGTVTILWTELQEHLNTGKGSLSERVGAADSLTLCPDSAAIVAAALQDGAFDGIPAAIGQPMQELIDRHALLNDPDIYEGGRMIALEDGAFRKVWLLTDALTEDFSQSIVQGIRADRLNLGGLCTGTTTIDAWREALGLPETTLAVDAARAESWRIVPGTSDYYTLGEYRLRLHADENGVLRTVFLMK